MLGEDDPNLQYDEPKSFTQRVVAPGVIVLVLVGAAGFGLYKLRNSGPSPRPHQEPPQFVKINIPPPPPPPPPPKQEEPEKQQEDKQVVKQEQPKPLPKEAPPPPSGLTAAAGTGADAFGLGVGNGEGDTGGGGSGEAQAYYNNLISTHLHDTLSRDDKLRYAVFTSTVAIGFDAQGRAVTVQIRDFSGDPEDRSEVERILRGFSLGESLPDSFVSGHTTLIRLSLHEPG
jgi:hypothetical protein